MMKPWDPENAAELWGRGAYLGTSSSRLVGGAGDSGGVMVGTRRAGDESQPPGPDSLDSEVDVPVEVARYAASERRWLREEILQIRADQNGYLSRSLLFTSGAIAFLFGLSGVFGGSANSTPPLLLIPLLVTLPSWWLFFDRECSLCRIVGYLRVLDEVDSPERRRNPSTRFRFEGWERALSRFRDVQELSTPSRLSVWKRAFFLALADALLMRGAHRKLSIYWYSFALLATVPLVLTYPSNGNRLEFLIPAAVVFVSGIYNLYLLGDLNGGRRSYDGAELMWTRVLRQTQCGEERAFEEVAVEGTARAGAEDRAEDRMVRSRSIE